MTIEVPALIAKLRQSPRGRVFYKGKVHAYITDASLLWVGNYEFAILLDNGREVILSDAYKTMGFVYRAPDSGSQMTNILVPLEDGEPDPVGIPDEAQLSQVCLQALEPLYQSVQRGDTDPDDLDFCRQLFSSPEAMLRTIQKEGSLAGAQAVILRNVFRIS